MSRKSFNNETLKVIGERIRKIRGTLNQSEYAELLGVGRPSVANYETGRRLPNRDILEKIAKIGNTTPDALLAPMTSLEKVVGNQIEFYDKFQDRIVGYLESCKQSKVLPENAISSDEFAILKILRELNREDSMSVIVDILNFYNSDPLIVKNQYLNHFAKTLKSIKKKGFFEHGKDLRELLINLNNDIESLQQKKED